MTKLVLGGLDLPPIIRSMSTDDIHRALAKASKIVGGDGKVDFQCPPPLSTGQLVNSLPSHPAVTTVFDQAFAFTPDMLANDDQLLNVDYVSVDDQREFRKKIAQVAQLMHHDLLFGTPIYGPSPLCGVSTWNDWSANTYADPEYCEKFLAEYQGEWQTSVNALFDLKEMADKLCQHTGYMDFKIEHNFEVSQQAQESMNRVWRAARIAQHAADNADRIPDDLRKPGVCEWFAEQHVKLDEELESIAQRFQKGT